MEIWCRNIADKRLLHRLISALTVEMIDLGACLLNPGEWDLNRSSQSESWMQQIRASGLM